MLDSCLVAHEGPADGITPGPNREAYTFRSTLIGILRAAQAKRPRTKWATKIQQTTSPPAEGRQTGNLQWRNFFVIPKERQIQRQCPDRSLQRVTDDSIDKEVLNKTNNKRESRLPLMWPETSFEDANGVQNWLWNLPLFAAHTVKNNCLNQTWACIKMPFPGRQL